MNSSPLGSSVHGILQAKILDWVDISFSNIIHYYSAIIKEILIYATTYINLENLAM